MVGAILLYGAIVAAALETAIAGAPVRWFVVAVTALYAIVTALRWRHWAWERKAWTSALVLLGTIAVTCWGPDGLTNGVRLAALSTSTVLCLASASGVALAAYQIAGVPRLPLAIRISLAALALYSVAAFSLAILEGDGFARLFRSGSFWRALPFALQGATLALFFVMPAGLVALAARASLRPPHAGSHRREVYEGLALIVVLAILVSTMRPALGGSDRRATSEGPASPPARVLAAPADVRHAMNALAEGRGDFRRERWDPAYVADRLGADPARLFAWVRRNTFWIPYQGVLRGPVGVLMDRQGNSLDRSLLLADLLGRNGRDVRLAQATLSREQAGSRIARALRDAPLPWTPPEEPPAQPDDNLRDAAARYQLQPDGVARILGATAQAMLGAYGELNQRVVDQGGRLLAAVPKPDRAAEFARRLDVVRSAMRDHWWVQLREGDRWIDLDLLEDAPGASPMPPSSTSGADALPASLYHDVTLRITAAQQAPGRSGRHTVLEHTFRPLDVIGRPMAMQWYPHQWPVDSPPLDDRSFEALLATQEAWGVTLYAGNDVVATGSVNARGESEAGGPMGGIGSAMGRAFGPSTELTAVSIEYLFRSPGLAARAVRRSFFDLTDRGGALDAPARLQRALALMTRTEILASGWELAPDYVADQAVERLVANRERLVAAASLAANGTVDTQASATAPTTPEVSPLLMLALARFEWSPVGHQVFHDRPNLITRHHRIAKHGDAFILRTVTDIVANEVGVDLAANDGFAVRLQQGVVDTNAESLLQFGTPLPGNTADAFVGATNWVTVSAHDDPNAAAGLTRPAARLAARDLEAGHVLVMPRRGRASAVDPAVGWWRVNPITGDTLGIGTSGAGESSTLVFALQETGVHYSLLETMAKGFIFQEAFCRAAPLPFLAMRTGFRMYVNSLAPELKGNGIVVRMQLKDSLWDDLKSSATASTQLCLFAAMAAGVLVTLPLVMMSLRFAVMGRVAVVAAEEGAARAAAGGAGRGGRPPRYGRGPARPSPAPPPPEPARPGEAGAPGRSGGKGPTPRDDCPSDWGRGRTDDGLGNYPPNSPSSGPLPDPALPDMPYVRPPAEDAAWAEDLANDVKAAQQQFDEALAEYRAAAEKVEALKGKTDLETTLAEQVAEKNLQNSRWGLARSQQRLAYSEQLNPAAQELRDAQAAMEEAMKAQDASWETYVEQFKRLQAAKEKYLEASSKKLSDFPANPMPSPGGGLAPDLPPPPPSGGGVCGGGTSASGGGSASGGSGASGGNAPNMSGTQDLGKTQPDMGSTMPGGRPGPTYAPVRYGQPSPSAPTRTMVGLGGMIGGS